MDFTVIADNWQYLLFGAYPDGPLEGAALTIFISVIAGIVSIILGTLGGIALAMLKGVWVKLICRFFRFFPCYSGHYADFLALFSITRGIRNGNS